MDIESILALFDQDQRQDVEDVSMRREVLPNLVRHVDVTGYGEGMVIHSRLDARDVDRAIEEQIAYFERLGQDFEWKVYDYDRPSDLVERLEARGFAIGEVEAIMVLETSTLPASLRKGVTHDVRRVTSPDEVASIVALKEEVSAEDYTSLGQYLSNALVHEPNLMSIYGGYVGGQMVSAGWVFFPQHSRFASLWGGSTLEPYRGRGLYTALLAVRAQEALVRGVEYLTVDASPMSRPILDKHGFVRIADSYPCMWSVKARS